MARLLKSNCNQLTLITAWCRVTTLELGSCNMEGQDADRLAGVLAQCPALAHLEALKGYLKGLDDDSLLI